jgi:hypothetical protein
MDYIQCPVCGEQRSLDYVGNILDKGTTHSSGMGMTFGVGAVGIAPTVMNTASMSDFSARFAPPARPGIPTPGLLLKLALFWILLTTLVLARTMFGPYDQYLLIKMSLTLIFAVPITLVAIPVNAYILYLVTSRARRGWLWSLNRLRNAVYCPFDNLVFDTQVAAYPRDYVDYVFRTSTPGKYALESSVD